MVIQNIFKFEGDRTKNVDCIVLTRNLTYARQTGTTQSDPGVQQKPEWPLAKWAKRGPLQGGHGIRRTGTH